MLSYDDERRLKGIEWTMSLSDPRFADGLRDGRPCSPNDDRRWPFLVWVIGALLAVFIGLAAVNWYAAATGGVGALLSTAAYRQHIHRAHRRVRTIRWYR